MFDKRLLRKLEHVSEPIIKSYENGMTLEEIARQHDCSAGTVRNLLKVHNVPRRKRGRKKTKTEEV